MERKSLPLPVTPPPSRNPSPVKSARRNTQADLPPLTNTSPLRQRIKRSSGQFIQRLTSPRFRGAPGPDDAGPLTIQEQPRPESATASPTKDSPRKVRSAHAGLGLTKTPTRLKPKQARKLLHTAVRSQLADRGAVLKPLSLPDIQTQMTEKIAQLSTKINGLKSKGSAYDHPDPLRKDGPLSEGIEALLMPVVERHLLEQCVQAIQFSPEPWPTQPGGSKLDFSRLSPEQVQTLCKTIADQAMLAQRLLLNLPEGFAQMGAEALAHMDQAFPEHTDTNRRVITGGLVFRSLMAPFSALARATLAPPTLSGDKAGKSGAPDGLQNLSPYIKFCSEVLNSFLSGAPLRAWDTMPPALQQAIEGAGRSVKDELPRAVTPPAV